MGAAKGPGEPHHATLTETGYLRIPAKLAAAVGFNRLAPIEIVADLDAKTITLRAPTVPPFVSASAAERFSVRRTGGGWWVVWDNLTNAEAVNESYAEDMAQAVARGLNAAHHEQSTGFSPAGVRS